MKSKLLKEVQRGLKTAEDRAAFRRTGQLPTFAAGTVIDSPQAYLLVSLGVAEPADDECREALGLAVDGLAVDAAASTTTASAAASSTGSKAEEPSQ